VSNSCSQATHQAARAAADNDRPSSRNDSPPEIHRIALHQHNQHLHVCMVQPFIGTHCKAQSVTCHMGSHSVTYHPTQVNTHCLNFSQTSLYLIYSPQRDGRLSLLWC